MPWVYFINKSSIFTSRFPFFDYPFTIHEKRKKKEIAKTIDVDNIWGPADASSNLRAKTNPFFPSYFFNVPVAVLKSFEIIPQKRT